MGRSALKCYLLIWLSHCNNELKAAVDACTDCAWAERLMKTGKMAQWIKVLVLWTTWSESNPWNPHNGARHTETHTQMNIKLNNSQGEQESFSCVSTPGSSGQFQFIAYTEGLVKLMRYKQNPKSWVWERLIIVVLGRTWWGESGT